jgi:CHAD domain-containing protein
MRLVEASLLRIYRQGRRRGARLASRGRKPSRKRDAALHDWRKRVKDLRYALEVLQREGHAAKPGRMRRAAVCADELGEVLGEDHDLALLAGLVAEKRSAARVPRGSRKALLKLIGKRRAKLQRRALKLGERLYGRRPKRFLRRIRADFDEQRKQLS